MDGDENVSGLTPLQANGNMAAVSSAAFSIALSPFSAYNFPQFSSSFYHNKVV
ncbi:MAG TPA: hypothetical protein H9780_08225 [Candidatus Mediterraneibacter merdavium]|nr:hypothetical protein [Candidatus Mediterraneibacter merdavium]